MQLVHLATALAALIAPVLSVPTTQANAPSPQPNYWWNVTQWNAGCGTKACHYSFHVTAPKVGVYPGFKADCAGKDTGYFTDCTIDWQTVPGSPTVSAKLKHQPDPTSPNGVALMGLSLQFLDEPNGATYNYTGSHTALFNDGGSAGKRFRVYPARGSATIP